MSQQRILGFLLCALKSIFGLNLVVASTTPSSPPAVPGWYINSWGLITRDRDWLLFLQKHIDQPWAIEPIYFAATFNDALKYLPICEGFQDTFSRDEAGRCFKTKPLYYTVDNDGEIYYTSEAAEAACERQPDHGVICVLTSETDAQARRDGWPDDY
ncbi:hypothetical protein B0H14DRAFT_3462268 [Mycena olivaceomarginata]|nr:hypothetical protein B0H14DRAFT_3505922 [Mycena olivaceomarginata]KAJ7834147.1 hypothetical protein B0H14DRAFT_3462268 [Mycena olivaceomarginata]